MSLKTIWCPVISAHVSCVANLEGEVTSVICPEFEAATGGCRRRAAVLKGGPLAQLLERVSEETLADSTTRCVISASTVP
jgi:hypothetical protein